MQSPWKTLSSRIAYETPWMKIREDQVIHPDGRQTVYGVIETPPSVYIIPILPGNKTVIYKQFRYPTNIDSWEFPGGSTDNQNIEEAAKRELHEETGFVAGTIKKVGEYQVMNGLAIEIAHVFIALDLTETAENAQETEGITEEKIVTFSELFQMIKQGSFSDGQSITAFTMAMLELGEITPK